MSYKRATFLALTLLCLVGLGYLWLALGFQDNRNRNSIGPGYFPISLSVSLLVLCAISFVQTAGRDDRTISIPNLKLIAAGLLVTLIFILAWKYLEQFYAAVFGFVFILFTIFSQERGGRKVCIHLAVAATLTLFIFLLFGLLIGVRF